MEKIKRIIAGRHTPSELRWHLAVLAVGYWTLVLCAWKGYPNENNYSIMRDMLSALGSFEERHNPHWFWVFSAAMIYCGLVMTPIILYIRRCTLAIAGRAANVGAFCFLLGCLAIALTGVFPYAHGPAIGNWAWSDLHMKTAVAIAISFSLGVVWFGALLCCRMAIQQPDADQVEYSRLKLAGPFSVCLPIFAIAGWKTNWDAVWEACRAAVNASLHELMAHLSDAAHGMAAFPLLEHMAIWALTLFVIWFAAVLPPTSTMRDRTDAD